MYKNAHKCSEKFVQKIEQNFRKKLDKTERVFYNNNQNKRAEQMYKRREKKMRRKDLNYDDFKCKKIKH